MSTLLDGNFLTILNLFVLLIWRAGDPYTSDRRSVIGIIVLIFAVIAVIADIVFIVLKIAH